MSSRKCSRTAGIAFVVVLGLATVAAPMNPQPTPPSLEQDRETLIQQLSDQYTSNIDQWYVLTEYFAQALTSEQLKSPDLQIHQRVLLHLKTHGRQWRIDMQAPRAEPNSDAPQQDSLLSTELWTGEVYHHVDEAQRTYSIQSAPPLRSWRPFLFTFASYRYGPHIGGPAPIAEQLQSMKLLEYRQKEKNVYVAEFVPEPPRRHVMLELRHTPHELTLRTFVMVLDENYVPQELIDQRYRQEYRVDYDPAPSGKLAHSSTAYFDAWSDPHVLPASVPVNAQMVLGRTKLEKIEPRSDVSPAIGPPAFKDGWTVVDQRLDVVYVVGETRIKVDGITYETTTALRPQNMPALEVLLEHARVVESAPDGSNSNQK